MTDAELADLCIRSYLPGASIEANTDLAASVCETESEIVIAFRGTANLQGWFRDFKVLPKSHELIGYCHEGFLSGASQLWPLLKIPDGKKVTLTGHSLGGALAVVVAALRIAAHEPVNTLVTFGAPRAVYRLAANQIRNSNAKVRQYQRYGDPVPEVPWDLIAFPYKHVASPTKIGPPKVSTVLNDIIEILHCVETWRSDHDILGYKKVLQDADA